MLSCGLDLFFPPPLPPSVVVYLFVFIYSGLLFLLGFYHRFMQYYDKKMPKTTDEFARVISLFLFFWCRVTGLSSFVLGRLLAVKTLITERSAVHTIFPENILICGCHFCPLFLITFTLRSRCAEEQTVNDVIKIRRPLLYKAVSASMPLRCVSLSLKCLT